MEEVRAKPYKDSSLRPTVNGGPTLPGGPRRGACPNPAPANSVGKRGVITKRAPRSDRSARCIEGPPGYQR